MDNCVPMKNQKRKILLSCLVSPRRTSVAHCHTFSCLLLLAVTPFPNTAACRQCFRLLMTCSAFSTASRAVQSQQPLQAIIRIRSVLQILFRPSCQHRSTGITMCAPALTPLWYHMNHPLTQCLSSVMHEERFLIFVGCYIIFILGL